jgi:murein DD-endopeptidase MepM/ murein hydrolase activator NlpD
VLFNVRFRSNKVRNMPLPLIFTVPGFTQTSGYGWRNDPNGNGTKFHAGEDWAAPGGNAAVPSATDGYVVWSGNFGSNFGSTVIVKTTGSDGNTYYIMYAELNASGAQMPAVGTQINPGDIIGEEGKTGNATGSHVHIEIVNGEAWNLPTMAAQGNFKIPDAATVNPQTSSAWRDGAPDLVPQITQA